MAISNFHVSGYRSIRSLSLELGPINVLVGANGCGKSNLYQALYLLAAAAGGQLARALADEGGMPSVLWAGERVKSRPVRMTLGVTLEQLAYELSCGLPGPGKYGSSPPKDSAFILDPYVKEEKIWFLQGTKKVSLLERENAGVRARDAEGQRVSYPMVASENESVLTDLRNPAQFPALSAIRAELLGWRFYHRFRTDLASPLRQPQVGVRTPILSHDGRDLAAALQTIIEIGDHKTLQETIAAAFAGAELAIDHARARFSLGLKMPEFIRPFSAQELSDGTLHFLCLLAALLSPRPPTLLVVNEPESSLHPNLLEPLARLIVEASRHSQIWITTHSEALASSVEKLTQAMPIRLEKVDGETQVIRRSKAE